MLSAIQTWLTGIPPVPFMARAPGWPPLERAHLALHPACLVCDTKKGCVGHHVIPVSWDASLELDPDNLGTVCPVHHFWTAHLGNFASYNPDFWEDCAIWHDKIARRPRHGQKAPPGVRLERMAAIAAIGFAQATPEVLSLRATISRLDSQLFDSRAANECLSADRSNDQQRIGELTDLLEGATKRALRQAGVILPLNRHDDEGGAA